MAGKEGITERKVAVITGASSGIGMATAYEFARQGYNVVLAARRMDELREVARHCEELGVETLAILTDVSSDDDMHDLCDQAVEAFGRVDVWVNNAAVYLVGKFEDIPLKEMRRLMDVNFFGYVHGSHAALTQFREQGYGTLINVSSVNATAAMPYVSIYSASKAAIRALDESLRMELLLDGLGSDIHVCTVMPATIDTNLFQNAANYSGKELQAIEPVYDPEYVAKHLFSLVEKPRREKYIGPAGTLMAFQRAHSRGSYENRMGKFTNSELLSDKPAEPSVGNMYEPLVENRGMRGGWREKRMSADKLNLTLGAVAGSVALLAGIGFILAKRRS